MQRLKFLALVLVLGAMLLPTAQAEDLFFDSNGVQIHYTVQGEGIPVVLIHGFTSNAAGNWGAPGITAALAEDYRVVTLDARGHGKSGKPHGGEHYGVQMANDVIGLLDHLKIEKAHIVGYSMGGMITINLLANHPDRFLSAVPAGFGWMKIDDDAANMNVLAESLEQGNGFAPLIEMLTPEGQPAPSKEQIDMFNTMLSAQNDVLALAGAARGFPRLFVTEQQLRDNKVPTLSIVGGIDPLRADVDELAKVMANHKVVIVEGADHMTAFANPAFISALKSFLASHGEEGSDSKEGL